MDKQETLRLIEEIALFGKGEKGITRLAFSDSDIQARNYIVKFVQAMGLLVRVDGAGNIIARLEGSDLERTVVMTGSHLDTVPEGGKYDGTLGVVAAIQAVKELQKRGPLTHPVEIVIFAAEESSRFGVATFGSKAMTGQLHVHTLSRLKDENNITFKEVIEQQGLSVASVKQAARPAKTIKSFVELHIEQGRILERQKNSIGIVDSIAAPTRCKITVDGVAAHSGTTPMDERQDALVSAAMIVLAVQEIALAQSHYGTVATVGAIKVQPGAVNVVPGRAEMWVDIRGIDHDSIIATMQELKDAISAIADAQETPVSIEVTSAEKPVAMDEEMAELIERICRDKKVACQRLHSGAGHDAMNLAHVAPSGLILIPCKDGVSHNPEEAVAEVDIMTGIEVLTEVLYQLAR